MTISYVLVEKKSSEISFIWKTVHICLYLSCAIVSIMLSNSMGSIWSQFDINYCILNSNLVFKPANSPVEMACTIDNVQTKWSKNYSDCNTHFMVYLVLFCASVIMLTYFTFLNVGPHAASSQMTRSWRILWVATLINAIAFVVAIVDASSVVKSVLELCRSFPDAKGPKLFPCKTDCLVYNDKDRSFLSSSFNTLAIAPWISVLLWGLSLAWCVIRMLLHPDFTVYTVVEVDAQGEADSTPQLDSEISQQQDFGSALQEDFDSKLQQVLRTDLQQESGSKLQQDSGSKIQQDYSSKLKQVSSSKVRQDSGSKLQENSGSKLKQASGIMLEQDSDGWLTSAKQLQDLSSDLAFPQTT